MPFIHSRNARIAAALAVTLLTACESETSATGPKTDPTLNAVVTTNPIDASSSDTLVKFSFATGAIVQGSADWDVAFRRYEVRLNGGASGTKGVLGYALDNNKNATNDQVLAFTVAGTLPAFDSVRTASIPTDDKFSSDRLVENKTAYLNLAGVPSANGNAYWKVKLANGTFGVFRVSAIVLSAQFALTSVTIESRLQSGTTLGAVQTVTIPVGNSTVSVSLATNQAVTTNGCNWDLAIDPQSFGLTVNSACNAGTYPGGTSPTFANATTASDAPQYGAFLSGLTGPIPNSVSDLSAPFRYNLQNTNRLHPSFNTYLIKTGANVYKLQVINYYNASGASGYPTVRYARIK